MDTPVDKVGLSPIARHIWATKYRWEHAPNGETEPVHTWRRVAHALAAVEPEAHRPHWERAFLEALQSLRFLPGGRILAGAGTTRHVTLFNCFVMGRLNDSMDGIFDGLREGAVTMQQGGGVGYDFSPLRPRNQPAHSTGTIASGPVSFMRVWDAMCATVLSTGARRGAMMATLRCDHPDIEEFIQAKREARELRHFNVSVLVTDALIEAVRADDEWPLVFPRQAEDPPDAETVERDWGPAGETIQCTVHRRISARGLWRAIIRGAYDYAEPGVLFIDRIRAADNLSYRERISATNPCGEIPLPPYGACDLGSINLTRFVEAPFSDQARLDWDGIRATAAVGTRLLDNVIDASRFPLPRQAEQARGSRRIGLGITGLGDALIMLGLRYDSEPARKTAAEIMRTVRDTAYRTSVALAREKGSFPFLETEAHLAAPFVQRLPADIRESIAEHGIRNSHLLAIAPTGTISLLANNVSSGVEPVYSLRHIRRILNSNGGTSEFHLEDYAHARFRELFGDDTPLPDTFRTAERIDPRDHLAMEGALQPFVDNAISKTINVPEDYPFESFQDLYERAYDLRLKGCTTFRPNPITGAVLTPEEPEQRGVLSPHCCSIEREGD